ncbi:Mercuric ion reductase [hydrothermal vent metagenome]|uniref:Mercuric ion reductase n=1 Tax=hydrothermal vent metagenome TaxID=652676 RepID=A0A3B0U0Q0_9ZZZZ
MSEILRPDICVIGAGAGGLTVAAATRAFGGSVVLIEANKMGGDCLNYGCVPSKALIAAARRAHMIANSSRFGVFAGEFKVNFGRVYEHVHATIEAIAPNDSIERFEALGVKVINDCARFINKRTVEAGGHKIKARRFVIATGSSPAIPGLAGLDQIDYLTNETIFELTRKPAHLIIIGAGAAGMELAQAYKRLGSEVSVIEIFDPLAAIDPELSRIVLRRIEAEGVKIYPRTNVEAIADAGNGVSVLIKSGAKSETIAGSHLLLAAGRKANIDGLGLEAGRIKLDGGAIRVNKGMKTSNRRVYAIGDVVGGLQFTHVASYQAGLVIKNALFGLMARQKHNIIPQAIYTDPEIAQVGIDEAVAKRDLGANFKILRVSFAENDRAQAEKRTEGLVKLIVDKKGLILGAGIAGAGAGELVSFFSYAIANRMKVSSLIRFVAPYPTLSEIIKRLGSAYYHDKLDSYWLGLLRNCNRLLP